MRCSTSLSHRNVTLNSKWSYLFVSHHIPFIKGKYVTQYHIKLPIITFTTPKHTTSSKFLHATHNDVSSPLASFILSIQAVGRLQYPVNDFPLVLREALYQGIETMVAIKLGLGRKSGGGTRGGVGAGGRREGGGGGGAGGTEEE